METNTDPTEELRDKTDKSLEDERGKTDDFLDRKSKTVENEASETIRLSRVAADRVRDRKRSAMDSDKAEQQLSNDEIPIVEDKSLIRERARSDDAQNAERESEDRARAKERFQKRLIAEALLEKEREETDSSLLDERAILDLESEQNSKLLSTEKLSHDLTKAALVTRDQFLAIVSHDLRNPLSGILMGTGLMRRNLSKDSIDNQALLKNIEIIERGATNMDRMISDLLDVERMAHNKLFLTLERVDLCALLQECKDMFSPIFKSRSISMNTPSNSESVFATVDHDRILQVLSNLVGNALKFTPDGGVISLDVQKNSREVEISVTDNGSGIEEGKIAQIFERFSQLKTNDRRGLGLGLFISKWIVEAHEGRICVDSKIGKGSVFRFTIPISDNSSN